MEQFNNEYEGDVKEKSIYLVHLDNTRIVILISVCTGIIALSFLIGMNFGGTEDTLFPESTRQDKVIESQINSQEKDDIDALLSKDDSLDSLESLDSIDEELMKENGMKEPETSQNTVPEKKEKPKTSANTQKKAAPKTSRSKPKAEEKKKEVVAASVKKDTKSHAQKSTPAEVSKKGFTIQIASFDSRSKAVKESDTINKMNYDSYIAPARVHGKQFYRVKIGPFPNKTEAFATLDVLHDTTRYTDSYITYEK